MIKSRKKKAIDKSNTLCYINYMDKDDFVTIRINKDDKELLRRDSEEEQRNVSNFLIWCWKRWRVTKRKKND